MTTTLTEQIAIIASRTGRPTRVQLRLARAFDIDIVNLSKQFARELVEVLDKFGKEVERATLEVLGDQNGKAMAFNVNTNIVKRIGIDRVAEIGYKILNANRLFPHIAETKDTGQDAMDALLIVESMDIAGIEADLKNVYEANYTRIIRATDRRTSAIMDLSISIIDETEAEILATTTQRIGLMDLNRAAKRDIFRQLGEGRLEGESVPQLARRIRDSVPAGRFKKASTRAQLIARTETIHAQRMAASAGYRDSGVTEVMIMDNRLGTADLATDPECINLNGKIVTLATANALMADEHPNGTRRMIAMPPPIEGEDLI